MEIITVMTCMYRVIDSLHLSVTVYNLGTISTGYSVQALTQTFLWLLGKRDCVLT